MSDRERLLQEIEAFLQGTGLPASKFGREALNDTALVTRLRDGGDVTLSTAEKIRAFIASYGKGGPGNPTKRAMQPAA